MQIVNGFGFVGPIGSGKSTMSATIFDWYYQGWLPDTSRYVHPFRATFAEPLKTSVAKAIANSAEGKRFGLSESQILKEMSHPDHKLRWRGILQWWGTDFVRSFEPNYWLNLMQEQIKVNGPSRFGLVDDVRFENEAEMLRSFGYKIIRLAPNPGYPDRDVHSSEIASRVIQADLTLPWMPVNHRVKRLFELAVEHEWPLRINSQNFQKIWPYAVDNSALSNGG